MKARRVHAVGRLTLDEVATPAPVPGGVLVRMQAAPVPNYTRKVLDGEIPMRGLDATVLGCTEF
jgi:NADPH:quinone reductase-like Zn-dependent oxidoreductase